ncbi:hypothetical protein ACHAXT_010745 [Thalassiosira profunda]
MADSGGDGISPSPGSRPRPLKRRRICLEDESAATKIPHLPAELWALALDFLPYDPLLQTAAVSRSMLRDVLPRVSVLHIERGAQLHAAVARRRYRDVRDIYIYSLLEFTRNVIGDDEFSVDEDTATRAVPFLCGGNFVRLERVFLGGRLPSGGVAGVVPPLASNDEDCEKMNTLINSVSAAYRTGSLATNVWVSGLCCPRSDPYSNLHRESSCLVCNAACRSFPLESVIDFECEGSSAQKYLKGSSPPPDHVTEQIYALDVCLKRERIEEIVKERGGRDLLHSEERLYQLLGRGTRHVVVPDEGKELFVVSLRRMR